jgi:hypothetical protein
MFGGGEVYAGFWMGGLKERDQLRELRIDGG